MSATFENTASHASDSQAISGRQGLAIGATVGNGLALARRVIADTDAHEIIEGGALMVALGATTVFLLGAFGLHIGAN